MKFAFIFSTLFLYQTGFSKDQALSKIPKASLQEVVGFYNSFSRVDDLLFAMSLTHKNPEDAAYIAELRASHGENTLPKAKLSGQKIYFGSQIRLEVLNPIRGLFAVNGRDYKVDFNQPMRVTLGDLQKRVSSQTTSRTWLPIYEAQAFVPAALILEAAIGLYSAIGIIVVSTCNYMEAGTREDSCVKNGALWPIQLTKIYNSTKGSVFEIVAGSCEKDNLHGKTVRLRLPNSKSGEKNEIYLKKKAFNDITVLTGDQNELKEQDFMVSFFLGKDRQKATDFYSRLEKACEEGGTAKLMEMIRKDESIRHGLQSLQKNSSSSKTTDTSNKSKGAKP